MRGGCDLVTLRSKLVFLETLDISLLSWGVSTGTPLSSSSLIIEDYFSILGAAPVRKGLKLGFLESGISKGKLDFCLLLPFRGSNGFMPYCEIISTVSSSPSFLDLFLVIVGWAAHYSIFASSSCLEKPLSCISM